MYAPVIYKYPLVDQAGNESLIPEGKVLRVAKQDGAFMVWVLQEADECRKQKLRVVGTGRIIDPKLGEHVTSVEDGPYIWHIFKESDSS